MEQKDARPARDLFVFSESRKVGSRDVTPVGAAVGFQDGWGRSWSRWQSVWGISQKVQRIGFCDSPERRLRKRQAPSPSSRKTNAADQDWGLNSTLTGSFFSWGSATIVAGLCMVTAGFRRSSCSRALIALSRCWNQVFSGQFQF